MTPLLLRLIVMFYHRIYYLLTNSYIYIYIYKHVFKKQQYLRGCFFPRVFSTAGVHDVNVSLGLGSGNAGRRDSFDRNTSAFSPSMDYARHKWPQYNTLGMYIYLIFFPYLP